MANWHAAGSLAGARIVKSSEQLAAWPQREIDLALKRKKGGDL